MDNLAFTKDSIDVDVINDAIVSKRLVIMPDTCMGMGDEPLYVTEIKEHKYKRNDGKKRYKLKTVAYHEADPCYCESSCSCGGNAHAYDGESLPLTVEEIAATYYFYPQYKIKLQS